MSTEAVIVIPFILILMAVMLISYGVLAERAFVDYEEGVTFLLSITEGKSGINSYSEIYAVEHTDCLTGKRIAYQGTYSLFEFFKPSRILYGILLGD